MKATATSCPHSGKSWVYGKGVFLKNNIQYILLVASVICFTLLFFPVDSSFCRDVSFSWSPNSDDPPVDGYKLYYKVGDPGSALSDYDGTDASMGNPSPVTVPGQETASYTLPNLLDWEKYSFVLTAYRGLVESYPTAAITLDALVPDAGILKAGLSTDPAAGPCPLAVTFDGSASTGNIVGYNWVYGDGQSGTGSIASHTYTSEGTYTATLTVTDSFGATDQAAVSIVVATPSGTDIPPTAAVSTSVTPETSPLAVGFDGSASTDSDGNIIAYEWDFGDGSSASGATVNHTYMTAGMFVARLTVTDNAGLTGTLSTPVMLSESADDSNILPIAVITSSIGRGYAPLNVAFDGGQSSDADGSIVSYAWNFGEGTTASGINVSHRFYQPGMYTITLKVQDNAGDNSLPVTFTLAVLDPDQPDVDISLPISIINYLLLRTPSNEPVMTEEDNQ